jgi:hypothetical protein
MFPHNLIGTSDLKYRALKISLFIVKNKRKYHMVRDGLTWTTSKNDKDQQEYIAQNLRKNAQQKN